MKRAQELDPLSVWISTEIGWVYDHARRRGQSIAQFQKTLELGAKSPWPQVGLADNYAQMGRYEEAIAELDQAAALAGDFDYLKGICGVGLSLAGRVDDAQQALRELQKTAAEQKVDPIALPTSIPAWATTIRRSRGSGRPIRSTQPR